MLEVDKLQPWRWITTQLGEAGRKRSGPRAGIWDTAILGGREGKEELAKETEQEQLTR